MSGDKTRQVLTIDHANKQNEVGDAQLYRHWVKQARLLREARDQHGTDRFRRDQVARRRS